METHWQCDMSTSLPESSHSILWQCPGDVSRLVLMTRLLRVGNLLESQAPSYKRARYQL